MKVVDVNKDFDKIIVVDPGKNSVEAIAFDREYNVLGNEYFPSKSKTKRNFFDIDSSSDHQYRVEYEGQKYLVGEGILSDYNFETTKNNTHHQICVYTAIANFVEKPNEKIYLIVGYPSSDFANVDQRNEYIKMLSANGNISFTLNEEEKTFSIVNVSVKPEGVAMKPRVEKIGKQKVRSIDIGGENINYRFYDEKGNTLESLSLDGAGVNHLESFLKTKLRKFINVDLIDVDYIDYLGGVKTCNLKEVQDSDLMGYSNSHEFMEDAIADFIEQKVLGTLKAKDINLRLRGDKILFTGGGSILLRPYLEEALANNKDNLVFSDTAYWDNCISYAIKDIGDRCKMLPGDKVENMGIAQAAAGKILKETNFRE